MKVNIAVCGSFHFFPYVRSLAKQGILNRFYYSHRFGTDAAGLGLEPEQAVNAWLKEYLVVLHSRLLSGRFVAEIAPLYGRLWEASVLRRWSRADVLHSMLHGDSLLLAKRASIEGSVVLMEPVNRQVEEAHAIVEEERDVLGLKRAGELRRVQSFQLEQAATSDFLLTASRLVRDSFVKRGYDAERTAVVHPGVDAERFRPLEAGESPPHGNLFQILCVGQVSVRKGQVYLLEACKRLALPNAELLFIGAISYEMKGVIGRYGGRFRHIRGVPNARLREFYGRASVFVLPSLEDGWAYVCAEAMACGLPVITTTATGASEIIEHGKDGFVVPPRSAEAIAECLEVLYRNAEIRLEMSKAALAKARTMGWDKYAERVCETYKIAMETVQS